MGTIKIKRGLSTNLPAHAEIAEVLYTTDTKRFYIGNGDESALTEFYNFADVLTYLNGKSNVGHTHTSSEVTNFQTSVESIITSKKGVANGLATLDGNGLVPTSQIPSVFKEAEIVQNITARNALHAFAGLHVLVLDASADETVETGGAEYVYNGSSWVKIAELNDLDAIIQWENIQNKPVFPTLSGCEGEVVVVNADGTGFTTVDILTNDIDGGSF